MIRVAQHLTLALTVASMLAVQPLAHGDALRPTAAPSSVADPFAGTLGCPNDLVDHPSKAGLPPYQTWISTVTAVIGTADEYLSGRLPAADQKTAVVLDIDNTSLESSYHPDDKPAVRPVLDLVLKASKAGASIIFITARSASARTRFDTNLRDVGYPVDELLMRPAGDTTTCLAYKTRTRADLERRGYTIVANIGNNQSDVEGGHAERGFKLPDYGGQLY